MRYVILALVAFCLVGCGQKLYTKTVYKGTIYDYLLTDSYLEDRTNRLRSQCYQPLTKQEVIDLMDDSTRTCLKVVSKKMPDTMTYSETKAYGEEIDLCTSIDYSKKVVDKIDVSLAPPKIRQECVEIQSELERLARLPNMIDEQRQSGVDDPDIEIKEVWGSVFYEWEKSR